MPEARSPRAHVLEGDGPTLLAMLRVVDGAIFGEVERKAGVGTKVLRELDTTIVEADMNEDGLDSAETIEDGISAEGREIIAVRKLDCT